MSGISSVTNTGADESTVQKYYAMNMMKTVMEEALGDGMEFEIFYQAMLESMEDKNSQINEMLSGLTTSNSSKNFNTSTGELLEKNDMIQNKDEVDPLVDLCIRSQLNKINNVTSSNSSSELEKIYGLVNKYSSKYGVDPNLVLQVINAESSFDTNAVSYAGAKGLMQLMPSVCEQFGVKNVFDPEENVKAGVQLLSQHLNTYNGDVPMALMAYNAGAGTVSSRGVKSSDDLYKMPSETRNYVNKIMKAYSGN